jgi:sugar phosphate isomerase/epimerase
MSVNLMLSRRDLGKLALSAAAAALGSAARIDSTFGGVRVGVQTYSFRDRPLDEAIAAMRTIGFGYAELSARHVQPGDPAAEREWRTAAPLEDFRRVRRTFDDAGIVLYAYTYNIREDFTDDEIEYGFKMARSLGVSRLNSSAKVSSAARVDRFAQAYKIQAGMHNHASMAPNEFSTPADFKKAMEGRSRYLCMNLDIGHFTAAGFDPVSFLEENHHRITTLHVKDRKRNRDGEQGENVPLGQGDTPVKEVLRLMKRKKYPIPAMIEYEYRGADTIVEVRRCLDYIKDVLA